MWQVMHSDCIWIHSLLRPRLLDVANRNCLFHACWANHLGCIMVAEVAWFSNMEVVKNTVVEVRLMYGPENAGTQ